MPWYKTGTVSVTLNSNAVIGTGTAFIANSRVGDAFRGPDGAWYEVTNIASNTALSISPNYQGVTNATGGYALAPMQGYVKDSADALRGITNTYGTKLAALGTTGNYDVLPVVKGGTGGTTPAAARTGLGLGTSSTMDYTGTGAARIAIDATTMAKVPDGTWRGLGGSLDLRGTFLESGTPADVTGIGFVTGFAGRVALGIPTATMPSSAYVQLTVLTPFVTPSGNPGQTTLRVARAMGIEITQYAVSATTWSAWSEPNVRGGANSTITSLSGLTTALSVAQGGTGNNTGTASKLAGAAILGTVSQAAGVPTGAIFETGSTANGEYIKYANGTMVCRYTYSATQWVDLPFNGAFVSGYIPWTFPVAFVARPNVIVTPRDDSALFGMVGTSGSGAIENIRIGQNVSAGAATRSANFVAIGRWF